MLRRGDRIEFRPGTYPYQQGWRAAEVVRVLPFRDALKRVAASREVPWPVFAEEWAESLVPFGDVPVLIVRITEVAVWDDDDILYLARWGEFTVGSKVPVGVG
jgi:hypothetical protein